MLFKDFRISKSESIKENIKFISPHPRVLNKSKAFNNI